MTAPTIDTPSTEPLDVRGAVATAAEAVTRAWPLDTFVAANPLAWLEGLPFEEAVQEAARTFGARTLPPAATEDGNTATTPPRRAITVAERLDAGDGGRRAAAIDEHVAAWCRLHTDHATWAVPGRDGRLWESWLQVTSRDRRLPRATCSAVRDLPTDPSDAIQVLLHRLGIENIEHPRYLQAHMTALPGWVAAIRSRPDAEEDLVDLAAVRLAVELLVVGDERPDRAVRPLPDAGATDATTSAALVDLVTAEAAYRDPLLRSLTGASAGSRSNAKVQVLCCIDPRSEGLRRHVEDIGGWETFGVAGFFTLPIRLHRHDDSWVTDRCPVILSPSVDAVEETIDSDGGPEPDVVRADADAAFAAAKEGVAAPLALAEVVGWWAAPIAVWRTFLPGRRVGRRRARPASRVDVPTESLDERVALAHGLLRAVGLTDRFAPVVLLCGHGSDTVNNPYAAALACGACGGHPGGDNARLAASLLNDAAVRRGLADLGVVVPDTTWFVAAEHDTASDRVAILDLHAVPDSHRGALAEAAGVLDRAGVDLRAERARTLPGAGSDRRRQHRGRDWAEVVPEWGLAGNAAIVIAPRSLTAGVDLERRTFLHSYEPDQDPDGSVLDAILGGPLVVAHWISTQYFFSTVDPEHFGAGTKATHNVAGRHGVLSGPAGDLRRGLAVQSTRLGAQIAHEPLRLLAAIEAPLDRIDGCLDRNPTVAGLVRNGWITVAARPTGSSTWSRLGRDGGWSDWEAS